MSGEGPERRKSSMSGSSGAHAATATLSMRRVRVVASGAMSYSDTERALVDLIPEGATAALSTSDLRAALSRRGIERTPRAIQKALGDLVTRHPTLLCSTHGRTNRWHWEGARPPLGPRLAPHQALGLAIAIEHSRALLPPNTIRWLDARASATAEEIARDETGRHLRWASKVLRVRPDHVRIPPPVKDEVFSQVADALFRELRLELVYRKRDADVEDTYELAPLGLCERAGVLALVARKIVDDEPLEDVRIFLLHRANSARVLQGKPARPPVRFDLSTYVRSGALHFPMGASEEVTVRIRVHRDVIAPLRESPIGSDQSLTAVSDDWFDLRATVTDTRAFRAFVLGYGPLVELLEPDSLRLEIAHELEFASSRYAKVVSEDVEPTYQELKFETGEAVSNYEMTRVFEMFKKQHVLENPNAMVIHGFASTGNSSKATQLAEILGVRVVSPTLTHRPAEDVASLEALLREERVGTVLGTSLGGFYALYLAQRHSLRVVLVNPATKAWETLADSLGTVSVFDTGETFEWTQQQLEELREIGKVVSDALDPNESLVDWRKVLVLLAMHDERIDSELTRSRLPSYANILVDEVQGHRFSDLSPYADAIRDIQKID